MGPGFGEGSISSEFGASGVAGEGGAEPRVYAWENVGEECEEIAALKRELEEQVGCPHSPFPASPCTNALNLARRSFPRTTRNGSRGLDSVEIFSFTDHVLVEMLLQRGCACSPTSWCTYPCTLVSLQESLLSEHQLLVGGNEAELETMIKDLRKELHGTQVRSATLLASQQRSGEVISSSASVDSHQFGEPGLFFAPKLTEVYRKPRTVNLKKVGQPN